MEDRPLNSAEKIALVLAALFLTPLVLVVMWFWWRDTSPLRAQGVWEIGQYIILGYIVFFVLALGMVFFSNVG